MARAAADDLARLHGIEVTTLCDARLPRDQWPSGDAVSVASSHEERLTFAQLAAAADATLVIAPEIGGALLERTEWALEGGGRLLGPGPETVALASDKHRLAEHLLSASVSAPRGEIIAADAPLPRDFDYPAVLKPLDGAGSLDVRLVPCWRPEERGLNRPARLEKYWPGQAASVAVVCGPGERLALPACEQRQGTGFQYLGARTPLEARLAARAKQLALAAIETLAAPRGYLGVDLVLGAAADGSQDVVIEVNPRLTTSYIALRQSLDTNLMQLVLAAHEGRPMRLNTPGRAVQFDLLLAMPAESPTESRVGRGGAPEFRGPSHTLLPESRR